MIPKLTPNSSTQAIYLTFLNALKTGGFQGDIQQDFASRILMATDNSIYQILPQAVIYPKHQEDLVLVAKLCADTAYQSIVVSARGGGTGTNGQSLTDGIVVDVSKYMNQILEINHAEHWVRVEAGVVKDQLNAALKPFGLFFAPELSTSNRATIGGMVNTDASGQGSVLYGKTRDHVLELTSVFLGGLVHLSRPLEKEAFLAECQRQDRVGMAYRLLHNIFAEHKTAIQNTFPKLNRCLTGYDLAHIRDDQNRFNLNNILCGSEGTLGFISEIKLNLLPIPKFAALAVVHYDQFNSALRDANRLMRAQPTSIETIDAKILQLAKADSVWLEVEEFFPTSNTPIQGVNLVEYTAMTEAELNEGLQRFKQVLQGSHKNAHCLGFCIASGHQAVERLWSMRKKAVGLLGNMKGESRPVPFIEDTAVPPEHLADYIEALRALLDSHQLVYGMFGHVDAGVLHVRPAIDMKDANQAKLIRRITDQVVELTHQYHGLLWGEHGKGVRSEYAPKFFGDLYIQLQRIKAVFDPNNQFNPGKIATPLHSLSLLKIDEVPTRGESDRQINPATWQMFNSAVYCNGNGLCYNWNFNDPMCPSWKATRERLYSPKGRASLLREWLKQLNAAGFVSALDTPISNSLWSFLKHWPARLKNSLVLKQGENDFSKEVYSAMSTCLACKSCTGQCPIKVDVPQFRSQFLALYHTRYARPLRDYLVGALEFMLPWAAKVPKLYNLCTQRPRPKKWLSKWIGFEDPPALPHKSLAQLMRHASFKWATPKHIHSLTPSEKSKSVILVQDAFTSYFEASLVFDILCLLRQLGFYPLVAHFHPNGKPLHVQGFLDRFKTVAQKQVSYLSTLSHENIPFIGIDPAMTLTFRSEYEQIFGRQKVPQVKLLQEWLEDHTEHLKAQKSKFKAGGHFKLMPHCTEKTNAPASITAWQTVFSSLGQQLDIVPIGCCGMSGTFGHESRNRETSAKIFDLSWRAAVRAPEHQGVLAATGFSCRSQTKREAFTKLSHPIQFLLKQLKP